MFSLAATTTTQSTATKGFDIVIGSDGNDVIQTGPNEGYREYLFGYGGADIFVVDGWFANPINDYDFLNGDFWFTLQPRRRK